MIKAPEQSKKHVEIPYEFLKHVDWSSLIQEQIDMWDGIMISRDEKRTRITVEYTRRE